MSRILIVDDEQSICWGLTRLSEKLGHEAKSCSSAEAAFELLNEFAPDLILLDIRLPGMDGLAAIDRFREISNATPIILMTAFGDLATAVSAVQKSTFEYIIKPFELDVIERLIQRALDTSRDVTAIPAETQERGPLIGNSPALQEVFKSVALAAGSDAGVLIYGESGSGKELVARALHQFSPRSDGPFVAVNVASLTTTLAESELFGHVRGAFTGAEQDRTGLLVQADGGTLFLDEVADIPPPLQVKLLRVLEHGEVLPVGSAKPISSSFRIISATHRDLLALGNTGDFRHDLYFRLGPFRIDLPPLRDRTEDIPLLARHFASAIGGENRPAPQFSPEAVNELERRPWYGNVRELRNAVEHAAIVAQAGLIEPEHLPPPAPKPLTDQPAIDDQAALVELVRRWSEQQLHSGDEKEPLYDKLLKTIEPPLFRSAIEKYDGQCATAARRLGIHRTTLRKKLDEYDAT